MTYNFLKIQCVTVEANGGSRIRIGGDTNKLFRHFFSYNMAQKKLFTDYLVTNRKYCQICDATTNWSMVHGVTIKKFGL